MTFGVASLAIPREWRCRHLLAFLAAVLLVLAVPRDVAFAADDDHYQLAVGDVLEFDFMDDEELPRQLTIADDGTVQAPLLGSVKVVGMPVPQAYAELRRLYIERQLFVDPRIALSVVSFRPVFVLGDVKTPGSFNYRPGLTVEKAIGLAGGLSTLVGRAAGVMARLRWTTVPPMATRPSS